MITAGLSKMNLQSCEKCQRIRDRYVTKIIEDSLRVCIYYILLSKEETINMRISSILKQFASQKADFAATLSSSATDDTRPCDQRNVYTRAQSELVSSPKATRYENEVTKERKTI
jgi:hypothetical protein